MRLKHVLLSFAMAIGLLWVLQASVAGSTPRIHYVAKMALDCSGRMPCYTSIQEAVNAADPGDQIRIAAGTYNKTAPATVDGKTYTQTVFINKSLHLVGGFAPGEWDRPDPEANPTIIDAGGQGRCITVIGNGNPMAVTLSGLVLTGGDYTGLGNPPGMSDVCPRTGADCGGGLLARHVTLVMQDMVLSGNIASTTQQYSDGGGALLWALQAGSRIERTRVINNSAPSPGGSGGGIAVYWGHAPMIADSLFERNHANGDGGGLFYFQPGGTMNIRRSRFLENTAAWGGGGLYANIMAEGQAVTMDSLDMRENQSGTVGGSAISLRKTGWGRSEIELANTLLAGSRLHQGDGRTVIQVNGGEESSELVLKMSHMTWADLPEGIALGLQSGVGPVSAVLTNTLLAGLDIGFSAVEGAGDLSMRHTRTLASNVDTLEHVHSGSPSFWSVEPVSGDPRLDANYRLQRGSAAIDAGVDAGVRHDMDGQSRPWGAACDIGADEFTDPRLVYLPRAMKNSQ